MKKNKKKQITCVNPKLLPCKWFLNFIISNVGQTLQIKVSHGFWNYVIDEGDTCKVQTAHVVTSIKQSPVLKGHIFLELS